MLEEHQKKMGYITAIVLKGGGNMNLYEKFNQRQINYLRKTNNSWFNVAEGGQVNVVVKM